VSPLSRLASFDWLVYSCRDPAANTEMSILAVPDELPGLIRRPGMTSWQVLDNNLNPAPHPDAPEATAEDAPEPPSAEEVIAVEQDNDKGREGQHKGKHPRKGSNRPNDDAKGGRGGARKSWSKTLWPVGDEKELGLEHCLRLYPHLQDTGAFFVCVLVKKADEEVSASTTTTATENAGAATEEEQVAPPAAAAEKRERASSPSRPEGEPEAKKVKQQDGEVAVAPASEMQVDAASASASVSAASTPKPEAKKEHTLGAGRPFNEEPYIYLPGLEDEQVQLIKYV
jgi:multisite-specific tRNA:(cytosine-C5)-methyltransferase